MLAVRAADDACAEADDPSDIELWTLHSGATYALMHHFSGKEGSSLDRYVRVANDVLFNPEATVEMAEGAYENRLADDEQEGWDGSSRLARLERVGRDVRERASQFEAREAVLRGRFQTIAEQLVTVSIPAPTHSGSERFVRTGNPVSQAL